VSAAGFRVRQLTIEDGMEIAMWRYPGPWAVYDALEPPRPDEGYWAVEDAGGGLVGFCCFGEPARAPGIEAQSGLLDVAIGLRPDLVGRGSGEAFARAVVDHAHAVAQGRRLRCVVPEWNGPGRRAAEAAGFASSGWHEIGSGSDARRYVVFTQD
jgi:ribosomal-protein-alanine N-acetyltransferase